MLCTHSILFFKSVNYTLHCVDYQHREKKNDIKSTSNNLLIINTL